MKKGFGTKPESKVLVLSFAIVACVILAFYVAFVIHTTIVYTHFFYIPLILAGMWYKKKAVAVALFLGIVHILVTHLSPLPLSVDVFGRAVIFIVVAYVIGYVSEQRAKGDIALRESEEKYRAFFKTSEDPVFITSKEGRWRDMNDAAVELSGYESRDELLKVNVPDLYENQEEMQRHLQLTEQHGFTKEFPVNLRRKDGSIINTLITSVAKKDVNGNVIGYQGTIRDITERKKEEAVLRESEEKYRLVVENANEAILVAQDGMLKFCNPKAVELTGYSKEELTSRTFVEFIHPDDLEMVVERHHKRLKGEELPHICPFRVIDKGGNTVWVEINAVQITWEGRPATLDFLSDVTERKRAEDALRESEDRFRTLAEDAPFGISIMNSENSFEYFNPMFTKIFGYTREDLPDKETWFEKAYPDEGYRKKVAAIWQEDLVEGVEVGKIKPRIFTVRCKDGQDKIIHFRSVVLKDGKHFLTYEDVTAQAKAEEALRESEEKYRELAELLPEVIFETDLEGNIAYANKVAFDSFGYTQNDFDKGLNVLQMLIPEDRDRGKENIQRVLNGETIGSIEYTAQRKDKTTFPGIINPNPIIRENKSVCRPERCHHRHHRAQASGGSH